LHLGRRFGWVAFCFAARRVQRVRVETRVAVPNAAARQNAPSPAGMRPFSKVRGVAKAVMQLAARLPWRLALLLKRLSPMLLTKCNML